MSYVTIAPTIADIINQDIPLKRESSRYYRGVEHDSLIVDAYTNRWYWNSKGEQGDAAAWLEFYRNVSRDQAWRELGDAPPAVAKIERQALAADQLKSLLSRAEYYHSLLTPQARAWWHAKGVTDAMIDHFRLGYSPRCPTLPGIESYSIPYFQEGQVINLRHRLAAEVSGKYRPEFKGLGSALFNLDGLARSDGLFSPQEAMLIEGEIKAIVLHGAGFRVAALAGKTQWKALKKELKAAFAPFSVVYIALDPGADSDARGIARLLGCKARIVSLPDKPDDMITGGTTPAQFYSLLKPQPGPLELKRRAQVEAYRAEAQAERAAKEAAKQAQQDDRARRWEAGNVVNFLAEDEIDPDHIEWKRSQFTNAEKWRDYVKVHWPDVDADLQYEIKLKENREARPGRCGEYRKRTLPNGQVETYRWTCGVCDHCLKRGVWIYHRALNEIQGIPSAPTINFTAALESNLLPIGNNAPGENAPPLPQVKGELSLVTVAGGDQERLKFARELRRAGIAYKCFPVALEDGPAYDFITNDDQGDPLGLAATDKRIELWIRGVEGKRASGNLLPSLKKLQERYRQALPYEIVLPELDDEGQPVDPDIFALELPDIGTTAPLPGVIVEFEVNDAASLQAALLEIREKQWKILGRRGDVNYGVYLHKKFYTRYSTLPAMLADFNAEQEAIGQRRHKKTG